VMTLAFQKYGLGEYMCALANDLPCDALRINMQKPAQI